MTSPDVELPDPELRQWLDRVAEEFESAWRRGEEPDLAEFLQQVVGPHRRQAAIELVHLDLEWSLKQGRPRELDYYQNRLPELLQEDGSLPAEIIEHFRSLQDGARRNEAVADCPPSDPYRTASPAPSPVASAHPGPSGNGQPMPIGRYRVERILGKGGFGCVYLAYDDQLSRHVAVKVPHPHLVSRPEDAQLYLAEARTVARLDHPHIVPVYDVGSAPGCPFFVVSKYVEGTNLATRLAQSRLPCLQAADLIATVAEALHYAHKQGLVHRDVKPGNILVASDGKPFVVDFGLALREEDLGKGHRYAGTPPYFSPEQARGEGHRVDGRSDIFSLGIVLYETLVGKRPFRADSQQELLHQISSQEARPPRQHDENIPKELERICFKALAKRASERYSSAHDLAEDLRHFLAATPQQASDRPSWSVPQTGAQTGSLTPVAISTPAPPGSESQPLRIVPKGLRSFDAHDSDFFLELLPGPRDREGLPDNIRFWKTKIQETDPGNTFSVGLIYGPSGCGKSSLVKAGLLPRLSSDVIPIYVEATADETEVRVLAGLRRRWPALVPYVGLKDSLAALRRGEGIPPGKKALIILDQFEQWLHAKKEETGTELMQALRQCDGGRVQVIIMVRDDFWLAVSRFLRELEMRLIEGQNSALADLFDADHAIKVLSAFGCAFGKIPITSRETSREQRDFLKQAVSGLTQEGKIICVRLALFAEMMKGRPWTTASLKQVGGTEGVGVTFLEETFSAAAAPPEHRYHQKAARAILTVLLPDSGANIKGHMRSYADLLEASGYADRPQDFHDLIRILDSEIRLITPTDPEGKAGDAESTSHTLTGQKYFQLTHDYLVPSLRDWLTGKQKETRKGRAELRLAEQAVSWNRKPENRLLPTSWEWLSIRLLTRQKDWTHSQQNMMRNADHYHALRGLALLTVLAAVVLVGFILRGQIVDHHKATYSAGLVQRLLDAETDQVPVIVHEMRDYRPWTEKVLREACAAAQAAEVRAETEAQRTKQARRQLHASLALLPDDPGQVEYLYERLLDARPQEVAVLRDALLGHKAKLTERLWGVVEQPKRGRENQRLRAACALAHYDPTNSRWDTMATPVVTQLVAVSPVFLSAWIEGLRPARTKLIDPLAIVFHDRSDDQASERTLATNILADYAGERPDVLAVLALDADDEQFVVIFPKLKAFAAVAASRFEKELTRQVAGDPSDESVEVLARRQSNAAVGLLQLNQPQKVWPLLRHSPDPRVRSYLIQRLASMGVEPRIVIAQLFEEKDASARRALLLSLAEYGSGQLPSSERGVLNSHLLQTYRDDPDSGIHGASGWLLRQWNQHDELAKIDKKLATGTVEGNRNWYLNREGQTLTVIHGEVEFVMGSPPTEEGREAGNAETQHSKRIGRSFAIAAQEVTVEQFLRFRSDFKFKNEYAPAIDCPINNVSWYEAAAYCNWLSVQEKIPLDQRCYLPNDEDEFADGMKLAPDYLHRTGYRLPTEAEWEFSCRAGAVTSRYHGQTEELLAKYAWTIRDSKHRRTLPVGSLRPNDLGLFDMLGNIWERCQDRYADYPGDNIDDKEDGSDPVNTHDRSIRGGSLYRLLSVRCADRAHDLPANRNDYGGFRVARTIP